MSTNPLNDISSIYMKEVFKPQLGKTSGSEGGTKKVEKGKDDAESSAKRIRQATYDIRYRARREDIKLDQAFNQYMGHTTMAGPEKAAVKEKLGLTDGGGQVKEETDVKKFKVRVTDKESGKSYVRYATREKINQLRSNPNISSVEMTGYGKPYEGEKRGGKATADVTSGKGLAKKAYDGDGKVESGAKEHAGAVHNAIQRRRGLKPDGKDTSSVKEGFSNWRHDLSEVMDVVDKEDNEKKITGMKSGQKNKVKTSAMGGGISFKEAVEGMGGQLLEMKEVELDEKAPPGAKFERMVKHIKKGYSKGGLTDKEKSIAYATAWKAKNAETNEEIEIEEGMTVKGFKANRKKLQRKEASADARKRGHEGKEWYNSGRTYGTDEAKSRRAKMSDDQRAARHRAAVDPDDDRETNYYSADKTKNPKKLRKQKAMGELGEQAPATMNQKQQSAQPQPQQQSQQTKPNPMDKKLAAIQKTQLAAKLKQVQQGIPLKDSYNSPEGEIVDEATAAAKRGIAEPHRRNVESRREKAAASVAAVKNRQAALDKHEKKTGVKLDISKSKEGKEHASKFPGSRQKPKVKGAPESAADKHSRLVSRHNQRVIKHGFTSKEKKEGEAMQKWHSARD